MSYVLGILEVRTRELASHQSANLSNERNAVMNVRFAKLDVGQTCGKQFLLTEVKPVNYVDGKRVDKPVAYTYVVVLPERKFEQLRVRIDGACTIDVPAEPASVVLSGLDLEIKWSQSEGHYIAGTATSIAIE